MSRCGAGETQGDGATTCIEAMLRQEFGGLRRRKVENMPVEVAGVESGLCLPYPCALRRAVRSFPKTSLQSCFAKPSLRDFSASDIIAAPMKPPQAKEFST